MVGDWSSDVCSFRSLSAPPRAGKEVRVGDPAGPHCIAQGGDDVGLPDDLIKTFRAPTAGNDGIIHQGPVSSIVLKARRPAAHGIAITAASFRT